MGHQIGGCVVTTAGAMKCVTFADIREKFLNLSTANPKPGETANNATTTSQFIHLIHLCKKDPL